MNAKRNLIAALSIAVLLLSVGAGVAFAGKPLGVEYQINGEPPSG